MTGFTRQSLVPTLQREFRILAMAESNIAPLPGVVALLTCPSVFSFVFIIQLVARNAGHLQLVVEQMAFMAGVARGFLVPATQLELGVFRMIELRFLPIFRGVTFFAFFAVAATVAIIDQMTGYANLGGFLVTFSGVA